jgi:putative ABC transport system permease protein
MFLAIKELSYTKGKFALIISVIVLVSYLVYFLTSLAYGLASSYTNAVNKWEATEIVITIDANDSIMMSFMTTADFDSVDIDGEKARLGLFPAVINNPSADNRLDSRVNAYFFGIDDDSFLKPTEAGNVILQGNQVIVDESLKKEGYAIGSTIAVSGTDMQFEIVGFSTLSTYQTAPVIYMAMQTWQTYRYNTETPPNLFSGVIVRGRILDTADDLLRYTVDDYIATLPGYAAQVLTFSTMIIFLIIIVAFVLGIFIYVLTIQKSPMFGVMKAQGISNGYIAGSVVTQTFLLVLIGIVFGFILTIVSGIFLADAIPFAINALFYGIITFAFFLFAFFGALFSVSAVLKIDPLKAIGG